MADIKSNNQHTGLIQIADDVIATIAGTAALEVEGIAGMIGNFAGGIIEKLGKKNITKGVNISIDEGQVTVNLSIIVKSNCKIQEVTLEIQKRVKTAIETMTGLNTAAVNINVVGIEFEKEKKLNEGEED